MQPRYSKTGGTEPERPVTQPALDGRADTRPERGLLLFRGGCDESRQVSEISPGLSGTRCHEQGIVAQAFEADGSATFREIFFKRARVGWHRVQQRARHKHAFEALSRDLSSHRRAFPAIRLEGNRPQALPPERTESFIVPPQRKYLPRGKSLPGTVDQLPALRPRGERRTANTPVSAHILTGHNSSAPRSASGPGLGSCTTWIPSSNRDIGRNAM